jgi:ABC-type nitrate/sulfonate/bicarbonate transport system substrate-binding protein
MNRPQTRKIFAGIAAGAMLLAGCAGETQDQSSTATSDAAGEAPVEMTFTGAGNLSWLNVFVAHEEGIFADHGIQSNVRLFDVGFLGTEAVMAGEAHTAGSVEFPLLNVLAQGADLVVPAVVVTADDQRIVVDSSIESPADLRGKRIGLIAGSAFEYAFVQYLEEHGVPVDEVEFVNVDAAEQVAVLARGDIDGFLNVEPVVGRALNEFGDQVRLLEPGIDTVYSTRIHLQMGREWVEANPEAVQATLRALIEANEFIEANRDRAVEIGAEYVNMEIEEVSDFLDDANFRYDVYWNDEAAAAVDSIGGWLVEQGRFDEVPKIDSFVVLDHLEAVAPDQAS